MKILILGAGKMGSFFTDVLSFEHEVAVFETDPKRLRFMYNCYRFTKEEEIEAFRPELVINAVTVKYTLQAFNQVMPFLPKDCIISDIASVKTDLQAFYEQCGFRYVSTHPMFGPTFANLDQLSSENAIIIKEGDHLGKIFFKDLYQRLGLNIFEYTFEEHDETMAYSLSIPFVSTFAHGYRQRRIERRRLPVTGNPVQPPHPGTRGRHPHRTERAAGHHQPERCREDACLSGKDSRTYKVMC